MIEGKQLNLSTRFVRCPRGHILGDIRRTMQGSLHVNRLIIYREAVSHEPLVRPKVLCQAQFLVVDLRCTICGETMNFSTDGKAGLTEYAELIEAVRRV